MSNIKDDTAKEIATKLILLLDKTNSLSLLPKIIAILKDYYKKHQSIGEVVSAVPLEEKYISNLEKVLSQKFGENIKLKNTVDKSILGGIIIRFRDMVINQSVKNQLEELRQQAYEN